MIAFHALGVRFCIPLLTLLFPVLAVQLGLNAGMGCLFLALSVHEAAHVLAAAYFRVQIREIRLMPFGGSARMENPYGVPAGRIIPVAAAGPGANLMLAFVFAALAQWKLISAADAAGHVCCNLVLCLFNLLPALPLDGGRILFALLQRRLGENGALKAGLGMGCLLSVFLLAGAAWAGLKTGRWNLSFIIAAVFILASARDERNALYKSRMQRLVHRDEEEILPVRFYQCSSSISVREALDLLRPRERCCFSIVQDGKKFMLSDERILAHITENGAADAALGELIMSAPGLQSAAPQAQELRI